MRKPATYLLIALSSFAILLVAFITNAAFLYRAGELESVERLVAYQQDQHAIVNTLYVGLPHYKYETYRFRKPEIVVIGTSRAMQFRAYHFTRSFYNLGGVDGRPEHYLRSYQNLLRQSPPELAIVVVDFWNYCYREGGTSEVAFTPTQMPSPHPGSIVRLPVELIIKGRLDSADYLTLLKQGVPEINGLRFLGVTASLRKHGFAGDGSRYSFTKPSHKIGARLATRWSEALERIATSTSNFRRDCTFHRDKVDRLLFESVDRLRALGTEVVLVFGPMPDVTLNAMAEHGSDYAYIDELRRYITDKSPVPVLDYHRGSAVGSPDCEFRDGFHGGEVTYMRMLLDAAERADNPLADYINLPFLKQAVAENSGRLTVGSEFIRQAMATPYLAEEAGMEGCLED